MKRFLLLWCLLSLFFVSNSQNLSFTCPQDVILGCNTACFTLTAKFPDIRAVGDNYTFDNVTPESICRPYVDPQAPGPSTNLDVDDTYSSAIPIGFTFLFYGQPQTSLVASTNGFLSFDITLADGPAPWTLNGNVPNTSYPRGLVMGPWHDLYPNPTINTSPNQQIKYNLVGTAPNRKWVLSFYMVPLFTNAGGGCNDSIYNTHQIVLHETTGVIEVFIKDKQLCPNWNSGKAMVGLQDMTRTKGIVPPLRGAVDPPWGGIGMNEVWRFIPTGGAPLYRSVELLDGTGTVVGTGDTTRVDINTFSTSFPNVCPPSGSSIYVVKTTYQSLVDPTATTYSLDTINVIRQATLPVTATSTPTTCGASTGTVTVTASGTPNYQYSIGTGPLQPSPVFTGLAAGTHTIYAVDATGCNNTITVEVGSISNLTSTVVSTNTSCTGLNDGSITVTPTAGAAPYNFSIDGGTTTQPTGVFNNLPPGIYTITFVDANLCAGSTATITITAGAALSGTNSHTNTSCAGATDGTITVVPSGSGTFTYTLNPGAITNSTGVFTNLAPGTYSVTFTNTATTCSGTQSNINITVGGSILATWCHFPSPTCIGHNETCPGAKDGVIVVTPNSPGSYTFTMTPTPGIGSATNTTGIFEGISPGIFYNVSFVNATGCTGSMTTLFVQAASAISATQVHTDANCPGVNDGTITVTPTPAGSYTYTLNPGAVVNTTGIFTGLGANTYTVSLANAAGCGTTLNNITLITGAGATATAVKTNTSCPGASDGTITITPPAAGAPFIYTLNPGNIVQNNNPVFIGLAANTYTITFTTASGCSGTVPVNPVIAAGPAPTTTAVATSTSCPGVNDGIVTVTPPATGGPFIYTLNPGAVVQNNNPVFTGLATGTYTITFTNAANCNGTVPTTVVTSGTAPTATAVAVNTTCPGVDNGTITITPPATGAPFVYTLNPGAVVQANNPVFTGLATGTYTITFTTVAGCSGTVTTNPVINAGPAPTATTVSVSATCPGINDGTITVTPPATGGPFIYTLNPGNIVQNNNPVFTGVATGTYTITFTNAIGCVGTVSPNPVVGAGSTPSATAVSINATCPGVDDGTITVTPPATGGPFAYTLNPGNIVQNNNPVFTGLATGTYTITFSTTLGCVGNVTPNPVVGAGSIPTATAVSISATCPGVDDGSITVTPPATGGPFVYTLNPGNVVQNGNPVFTGLATGTYTITFTTSAGCIGNVNPNPTVGAGSNPTTTAIATNTTCPGVSDGAVTVTVPVSGGPFTYTLNPGAITNATGIFTGLAPGPYSITYTTGIGCNGTVSVNPMVGIGAAPTATAIPTSTTCPGVSDGIITVTPPATGGPFFYTLNPGNIVQNNNPVFTGLAPDTYTITFTTAAGCSGTVTNNIAVLAGPALTANAATIGNPPCANINDGTLTIVPSLAGIYTYVLNPGPGQVSQFDNPTFTGLAPGNYSYTFTNASGCIGSGTATLTTHAPLALGVVMTMPLCNGSSDGNIKLTASGGLAPYQYALSPFTTYQAGTFNGLAQGSYTFRVRDAAGCTKDTTVTLNQPTVLTAGAVTAAGTCNGNDGQILVTGNAGTPVYTYSIDGINFQAANNFVVSGAATPGAVFANITVKDNNGCLATAATVYVGLTDNMLPLVIGNDTSICAEQSITFQPQVSPEANVFTWSTIPDPLLSNTLDNTAILNATATPLDTTTYVLTAQWGVCSRTDTISVYLLHKPIAHAGQDTAVCFDKTVASLHGSATNLSGTVNYQWTNTTNLQTPNSSSTLALPQGTETFTLTVTDNYGCNFSVTDEVIVMVQPPVPAFAGNDTSAVIGEAHQLYATGGLTYMWSPGSPLNFSNIQNPLATLQHDQLFEVTVTDANGCVGTDRVYIQVYPPGFHLPNAFTPNGDGLNDIFRVIPAGIAYTEWFRIFNRYGQLVFETNQYLKGWDGTFQGKKQPLGNYIWILKGVDKNNRVIEMKGTVLMLK